MADGSQATVIAKRIEPDVLAAEVFCSLLGREAGLPIPEPVILKDLGVEGLMFGTVFAEYPNLLQAFRLDPKTATPEQVLVIARRLVQWSQIDEAIGFDEWVFNVDRNLQNLLWDGFDHFVLIDHDRCLGRRVPGRSDENWLLKIALTAIAADAPGVERLKVRVLDSVLQFEPDFAREAAEALRQLPVSAAANYSQAYFSFVTQRLPVLAAKLAQKFPSNQFPLEGV